MEALVEWLKWIFGQRKWGYGLAAIVIVLSAWQWQRSEMHYHIWAGSYNVHHFDPDSIEYSDGKVRVFWVSFPKVAPYGFEEQYILHRINGEPLGIDEFEHPYPRATPYRDGYLTEEINIKYCNCQGNWIDVGRLPPGTYSLEIRYDYDVWWLPDWSADQRIIFEVPDEQ